MDREVLSYINYLEGCKTAIKSLHWDPDNMSQHKLDDEIADAIADFQDQVAEVEQGIHGQLPLNQLKGDTITVKDLESFVQDVISKTTDFYKQLDGKGDEYIGMRSDCESFLSAMQKNLYLLRFTIKNAMKEEMKRRIKANLREAMYKNVNNHDTVDKFMGRRPVSAKSRINQIYRIVKVEWIEKTLHDHPLKPQQQGAAEEQGNDSGNVRAQDNILHRPDPVYEHSCDIKRGRTDERCDCHPLQVNEWGITDYSGICVECMECNDERNQPYKERQDNVPESRYEHNAAALHIISEETGEQDHGAVDKQYAPVGYRFPGKIPVGYFLQDIHLLSFPLKIEQNVSAVTGCYSSFSSLP